MPGARRDGRALVFPHRAGARASNLDRDIFKLGNLDATLEHSTRFVLVDRQSRIRGYYETSESGAIPKVIDDINALARESS